MSNYPEIESKMKKTAEVLRTQLASVRAGRANAAVLDQITVDYYGVPTPIQQVASISVPDPRSLMIQPWDGSVLKGIEKAILASDLGINPQNDGRVIRLVFPQLTEERRKELAKQVKKYGEESKVAVRNIRRDAIDKFKKQQKASEITEDDYKDIEKDIQKLTDDYIKEVESIAEAKEKEQARCLPRHIAIILDGNGRWAKKRLMPRNAGHLAGSETFRNIATYCKEIGVEYLTVYAFSTENWKRPEEEVGGIMKLLDKYLHEAIRDMRKKNIRMKVFGDVSRLSPQLRELIAETDEISQTIEGFQANICINYGGRAEIVRAAQAYAEDYAAGRVTGGLTEDMFSNYMYSAGIPDPELLIRPGGEYRLSNFLLWQCAYSEFYYTDTLWPDFTPQELDKAIEAFNRRDRRFGGVKP